MTTDQTIAQMLQTLQSLATEYAPAAFQIALTLKRVDGIQALLIGILFLALGLALLPRPKNVTLTPEQADRVKVLEAQSMRGMLDESELKRLKGQVDWSDSPVPLFRIMFSVGGFVVAGIYLLDIWAWVAAFNPALALAHDLLVKVTQ